MAYPNDERAPQRPARPAGASRPANGNAARPTYNSRPANGYQRPANGARPAGNPQRRPAPQPPRRKAQPRFFVFLAILLAVLALAIAFVVVKFTGKPAGTPDVNPTAAPAQESSQPTDAAETVGTLTSEDYQALAAELGKEDSTASIDDSQQVSVTDLSINPDLPSEWLNVLLLGTDERDLAANGRTDSMIICSVNRNTGEVKLASIMRDLAVDYADIGYPELGTARINSANFFGDAEMAMKTVNELFGLNIQHYALINFFGFQDAVNALGGITMDITEAEMNKINEAQKQVAGIANSAGIDISGWDNVDLTEYGDDVRLNGQQALGYARIRKLDSDFGRSERQRKVLMAMLDEVKTKSALEIAQLGATLMPYLTTNMDLNEIMNVAMVVLSSNMQIDSSMRLPVNGTYTQERRNDMDLLWDCDFVQNQQELYNYIYN